MAISGGKAAIASKLSLLVFSTAAAHLRPFLPSKHGRRSLLHFLRIAFALSFSFLLFLLSRAFPSWPRRKSPPPSELPHGVARALSPWPRRKSPPPSELPHAVARALSDILSLVADIPASSRKYDSLRSLADRLLSDNLRDGFGSVNRAVLSSAFSRTLRRLEARLSDSGEFPAIGPVLSGAARSLGLLGGAAPADVETAASLSGEKWAAELLWVVQRLVDCGAGEEAVRRWGAAGKLAGLALIAEPRMQATLVNITVYLLNHGSKEFEEREQEEDRGFNRRESLMMVVITWLPLLCQAPNGVDTSVLSSIEKAEVVKILEMMIERLDANNQEKVLTVWLRHFAFNSKSDWPDLQGCFARWYSASRELVILQ